MDRRASFPLTDTEAAMRITANDVGEWLRKRAGKRILGLEDRSGHAPWASTALPELTATSSGPKSQQRVPPRTPVFGGACRY